MSIQSISFVQHPQRWLLLGVLGLLAGCRDIEIRNGEIPEAYLPTAQALAGAYRGEWNRKTTTLLLRMEGRRPVVEVRNSSGSLLPGPCRAKIGPLKAVTVEDRRLKEAVFDMNITGCEVLGNELRMKFQNDGSLYADLLDSFRLENSCYPSEKSPLPKDAGFGIPAQASPASPDRMCHWQHRPVYLKGNFKKAI